MKRQHLPPILLSLLLLFCVTGVRAQTYGLQYWFDKYVKSKVKTISISGSTLKRSVDVSSLTQGIHIIYMRVKSSDGTYSPVTSSPFFKFNATTSSILEYWFDDNYANHATMPISANTEALQILDLDFSDMVKFPIGFHRLNMRLVAYGNYSPVYSASVMRLPDGEKSEITYWLDDNYDPLHRNVVKGRALNTKTAQIKATLNLSSASKGMHRFHYRITTNGYDDGVVYEVPVLVTELYNKVAATVVSESKWMDEGTPASSSISNPESIVTRGYVLNAKNYSVGQHAFHVQYQNSAGVWGEPNVTYFYKEASGKLRAGIMPGNEDGIEDAESVEVFCCECSNGTLFVDCLSPNLAANGMVVVYDLAGKVVARKEVHNTDGIHAEISMDGFAKQMLIVKLICGGAHFNKKVIVR